MKMKTMISSCMGIAVCCLLACSAGETKPAVQKTASSPAAVSTDTGKRLYEEKCAVCHGSDGTAGIAGAADLRASRLDSLPVISVITHGKKAMPAFTDQLGTGEIEQIASYVFTLRQ